jgi:AAA15 family ATPase/GTPase
MLAKIIIKNFKSFKNETIIDFIKTNYTFLSDTNAADNGVLKSVMFVGANASGKSNAILAIKLLLDLLFMEREINSGLLPCLFSDSHEFSIDYYFKIEGKQILYQIKNNPVKSIIYEKLYIDDNLLLERMGLTAKSYINDNKESSYDENELDKETLSLRTIFFNTRFAGNDILRKWFEFLQNSIYFNAFEKRVVSYGKDDLRLISYLKENGTKKINDFFDTHNFEQNVDYANEGKGDKFTIKSGNDEEMVFFRRKGINVPIPFMEESLGNRTLLDMLPSFLRVLENNGILLIDEFSSGFHNELEELLVKYFMQTSVKSQMIFVSHSTNLLTTSILRPDQIYSVDFNGEDGSRVKRFSDEQPRVAQNLEKMYLSGVFEGLPNYKNNYEN